MDSPYPEPPAFAPDEPTAPPGPFTEPAARGSQGSGGASFAPRIPPNDTEAERSVLSSMLYDREAIAAANDILTDQDFYRPDHQALYDTMAELYARGEPVDAVTLGDRLREKGLMEMIGGVAKIAELAAAYYTSAHIRPHARIVAEKATLRRLIRAANEIAGASYDPREDAAAIIEHAEKLIFDIAERRNISDFAHIKDILTATLDRLEELGRQKGQLTGVETGFVDFDQRTAGLQPAELIVIGARPSMGKTVFLLNVAQHAAVRNGVPTAFFSLEMSKESLVARLLSSEAGVEAQRIRVGDLRDEDWDNITASMEPLSKAPLYIDDNSDITVAKMREKCRKLKLEKGLGLVMIDYIQLMGGSSSRPESRQLEVTEISRSLKGLAKELHVPVLAAAQVSRACEARKDHRPMLSDLRESGAIEQDADVVAFLYRDVKYNPETLKPNLAEVIIAKQRNGPTGTVELTFQEKYTKFVNTFREM